MLTYNNFLTNLKQLQERIDSACASAGRDSKGVQILPVTKNHPVDAVSYAAKAGLIAVGENRVQEASDKKEQYDGSPLRWELIGHLQSNKAKVAAALFDRIQSVDSEKLVHRLDAAASGDLHILLQINAGEDPAKYGADCDQAEALLVAVLRSKNLSVDGLMTIAPLGGEAIARKAFERLRSLRDQLQGSCGVLLPELSMGMTGDLEAAIAEGSTMIRVGTALYGERDYSK